MSDFSSDEEALVLALAVAKEDVCYSLTAAHSLVEKEVLTTPLRVPIIEEHLRHALDIELPDLARTHGYTVLLCLVYSFVCGTALTSPT